MYERNEAIDKLNERKRKAAATNITSDKEPVICEKCGATNWIGRKPFSRREKKVRVVKLDDVVWTKFRRFKAGFPDSNSALAYIIHKIENLEEEYEELDSSDRFKGIIVQQVQE